MLNLTQHSLTADQLALGVVEPTQSDKALIKKYLTFDNPPTELEMVMRATNLASLASEYQQDSVLIGGAAYFMPYLIMSLKDHDLEPNYSFTKRVVTEQGGKKISHFQHVAFIKA